MEPVQKNQCFDVPYATKVIHLDESQEEQDESSDEISMESEEQNVCVQSSLGTSLVAMQKEHCDIASVSSILRSFDTQLLESVDRFAISFQLSYRKDDEDTITGLVQPFKQQLQMLPIRPAALHQDNFHKNRYSDCLPYEHTAVRLSYNDKFYFNADMVELHGKKYIMTQAPLQYTLDDFFEVRKAYQVSVVVALTEAAEDGKIKSFPYWEAQEHSVVYTNGQPTKIICTARAQLICGTLSVVIRKFQEDDDTFTHIHVVGWKDNKIIAPEELCSLVNEADVAYRGGPIMVHCSAGVNRSGVFVLAHANKHLISQKVESRYINPCRDILLLQMQRMNAMQNRSHIALVLRAIQQLQSDEERE